MKLTQLLAALAEGEIVQRQTGAGWISMSLEGAMRWALTYVDKDNDPDIMGVRIKPEPKPDKVSYGGVSCAVNLDMPSGFVHKTLEVWDTPQNVQEMSPNYTLCGKVKYVFDGETGELKSVEIVK